MSCVQDEMTDIYRDPTDGATARRVDLLRRRRDELVTMPHAIRRVVVARGARLAAAWAMAFVGALLVGSAASPRIAKLVGHVLPPDDPAVIATGLIAAWLGGALVYAIARAVCEHRFTIAMTKCVLPGDDLHEDLERLAHEQPDEVARRMAHRLEVRSAALPVMAAALVGPATFVYCALAVSAHGWPANRIIEHTLGDHAGFLFAGAIAGLVAALCMLSPRLRAPAAAVPAGVIAITALVFVIALHRIPTAWYALPIVAVAGMIAVTARKLAIERAWIETDTPASELFDVIAARAAQLRGFLAAHYGHVVFVLAAFGLGLAGHASHAKLRPQQPTHIFENAFARATLVDEPDVDPVDAPPPIRSHLTRDAQGAIIIELSLHPGEQRVPTGLIIPPGWSGTVWAHVDEANTSAKGYEIDGIGLIRDDHRYEDISPTACTTDPAKPIVLQVRATQPGQLRLIVTATMRPANC